MASRSRPRPRPRPRRAAPSASARGNDAGDGGKDGGEKQFNSRRSGVREVVSDGFWMTARGRRKTRPRRGAIARSSARRGGDRASDATRADRAIVSRSVRRRRRARARRARDVESGLIQSVCDARRSRTHRRRRRAGIARLRVARLERSCGTRREWIVSVVFEATRASEGSASRRVTRARGERVARRRALLVRHRGISSYTRRNAVPRRRAPSLARAPSDPSRRG